MCSRCVVALTVVAVFTFCKAANGGARVSDAEEPQTYGLPITTPLGSRRQSPARLLKSVAASGVSSYFEHIPGVKWLSKKLGFRPKVAEEGSATSLFHAYNLEKVNARRFFRSREFKKWEKQVKLEHKGDADGQMFSILNNQFTPDKNGGVEPIIALALNHRTTRDVGLRFENELLRTLAAGMKEGDHVAKNRYLRYGLYRNPKHGSLDTKMQRFLGDTPAPLIKRYQKLATQHGEVPPFEYLEKYFYVISGGERIKDIYLKLLPTKGFDNNDFLFQKLYEEAARNGVEAKAFAKFMLNTFREERRFTVEANADYLIRLKQSKISKDLRIKVVNPLYKELVALMPKAMRRRYKKKTLVRTQMNYRLRNDLLR